MTQDAIAVNGPSARNPWLAVAAVLVLWVLVLLALLPYMPGTLGNVDASAKIWQIESVCRNSDAHLIYPAVSLDPEYTYVPSWYIFKSHGKPYTIYLNLFTFVEVGGRRLLGDYAFNLVPFALGVATLFMAFLLARRCRLVPEVDLWKAALVIGVCTPLLYYSYQPQEHILATALVTAAFLLAAPVLREGVPATVGWPRWMLVGALLILAALARIECFLLALAMGLALLVLHRSRGWLCNLRIASGLSGGGLLVLAGWFLLNPRALDTFMGQASAAPMLRDPIPLLYWRLLVGAGLGSRGTSLLGEHAATAIRLAIGACLILATALAVSSRFRERLQTPALVFLALAMALLLPGFESTGLLAVCPFILLAALAWRKGVPSSWNTPGALVLLTSIAYIVLCGLILPRSGETQFGPRFLMPVIPALAVTVYGAVRRRLGISPDRWLGLALALSLLCSFAAEAKGIFLMHRAAALGAADAGTLRRLPPPFVYLSGFAIYRSPSTVLELPILEPSRLEELPDLFRLLRRNNIRTFTLISPNDAFKPWIRRENVRVIDERVLNFKETVYVMELSAEGDNAPMPSGP